MLHGHVFAEKMRVAESFRMPNIMDNDACLFYIIKGKSEVYSPTEKVVMEADESVLMKCGNYIGCAVDATPTNMHESVGFHFHPDVVQKLVSSGRLAFDPVQTNEVVSAVRLSGNEQLRVYVEGLKYYLDHPEQATDAFIELKMQELMLILINSGKALPFISSVLSRLYKKEEVAFNQVIEANMYNNLSIPEMAILTHRSESTFKRDFKKYYGDSPARYLRQKRVEKAADLLVKSDLAVSEVAWECGFENAAHFSKTFFDHFDAWPRDYRMTQMQKPTA